MKRELLSSMVVGEEKRLTSGCRSYYIIKRVDDDFFRVKLFDKYDNIMEKYRIPVSKIDDIFKEF